MLRSILRWCISLRGLAVVSGAKRLVGRVGKMPVIAVRVTAPLHTRIIESAKRNGRSMSEEMAALLEDAFAWQDAHGERGRMLQETKVQYERFVDEHFDIEMKRRGWQPLHGSPYWLPPGSAAQSGFIVPAPAVDDTDEIDRINAAVDALEVRLAKLKQAHAREEAA